MAHVDESIESIYPPGVITIDTSPKSKGNDQAAVEESVVSDLDIHSEESRNDDNAQRPSIGFVVQSPQSRVVPHPASPRNLDSRNFSFGAVSLTPKTNEDGKKDFQEDETEMHSKNTSGKTENSKATRRGPPCPENPTMKSEKSSDEAPELLSGESGECPFDERLDKKSAAEAEAKIEAEAKVAEEARLKAEDEAKALAKAAEEAEELETLRAELAQLKAQAEAKAKAEAEAKAAEVARLEAETKAKAEAEAKAAKEAQLGAISEGIALAEAEAKAAKEECLRAEAEAKAAEEATELASLRAELAQLKAEAKAKAKAEAKVAEESQTKAAEEARLKALDDDEDSVDSLSLSENINGNARVETEAEGSTVVASGAQVLDLVQRALDRALAKNKSLEKGLQDDRDVEHANEEEEVVEEEEPQDDEDIEHKTEGREVAKEEKPQDNEIIDDTSEGQEVVEKDLSLKYGVEELQGNEIIEHIIEGGQTDSENEITEEAMYPSVQRTLGYPQTETETTVNAEEEQVEAEIIEEQTDSENEITEEAMYPSVQRTLGYPQTETETTVTAEEEQVEAEITDVSGPVEISADSALKLAQDALKSVKTKEDVKESTLIASASSDDENLNLTLMATVGIESREPEQNQPEEATDSLVGKITGEFGTLNIFQKETNKGENTSFEVEAEAEAEEAEAEAEEAEAEEAEEEPPEIEKAPSMKAEREIANKKAENMDNPQVTKEEPLSLTYSEDPNIAENEHQGVEYTVTRILAEGLLHKKGSGDDWMGNTEWKLRHARLVLAKVKGYEIEVPVMLIYWYRLSSAPSTVIVMDQAAVIPLNKDDTSKWDAYCFQVAQIKSSKDLCIRTFTVSEAARDEWMSVISQAVCDYDERKANPGRKKKDRTRTRTRTMPSLSNGAEDTEDEADLLTTPASTISVAATKQVEVFEYLKMTLCSIDEEDAEEAPSEEGEQADAEAQEGAEEVTRLFQEELKLEEVSADEGPNAETEVITSDLETETETRALEAETESPEEPSENVAALDSEEVNSEFLENNSLMNVILSGFGCCTTSTATSTDIQPSSSVVVEEEEQQQQNGEEARDAEEVVDDEPPTTSVFDSDAGKKACNESNDEQSGRELPSDESVEQAPVADASNGACATIHNDEAELSTAEEKKEIVENPAEEEAKAGDRGFICGM